MASDGRGWLLLVKGDNRQFAGNDGYSDEPDVLYRWDSTVPNCTALRVGDPIALWDGKALLGVSTIETIEKSPGQSKILYRCPRCQKASIKERRTKKPAFRCQECHEVFDQPETVLAEVTQYESRHDAAWKPLEGALDGATLRGLCEKPRSQHSMRALRWGAFIRELVSNGVHPEALPEENGGSAVGGGHRQALVRVRLGQGSFRKKLLKRYGPVCAVTGEVPESVLEAGHLYSYASVGEHHKHGGLLLRRDIHRLFDLGHICIDPRNQSVDLSADLLAAPAYRDLQGSSVKVRLTRGQLEWLHRHWSQHRAG